MWLILKHTKNLGVTVEYSSFLVHRSVESVINKNNIRRSDNAQFRSYVLFRSIE